MNDEKSWYETEEGKEALLKELNRRFKFNKDGTIEDREPKTFDKSLDALKHTLEGAENLNFDNMPLEQFMEWFHDKYYITQRTLSDIEENGS